MSEVESVRDWFARLGTCVAAMDFHTARGLFDDNVVGFGTYKDMVRGIDAFEAGQWRNIWPTIEGFTFNLDSLEVMFSPDGQQAGALIGWDSIGIDASGARYDRPGRATVVLRRVGDDWRGLHTHFSQCPAERKSSFGDQHG